MFFDTATEINLTAQAGQEITKVKVRWPSDQEWHDRQWRRKIIIKRLGRGITETIIDSLKADETLYAAIKLNGAPDLTPAEAQRVINALYTCDVTDVEIDASEAEVTMVTAGGEVRHRLKIPTTDQAMKITKAVRFLSLPYNVQQMQAGILTAAEVYDQQGGSSQDYAGAIPATHKDAAVRAIIERIDNEMGATSDEKFF